MVFKHLARRRRENFAVFSEFFIFFSVTALEMARRRRKSLAFLDQRNAEIVLNVLAAGEKIWCLKAENC